MSKPIIAITGPTHGAFGPRFLVAAAVRLYGGQPLQVRPGDPITALKYDGVVVTGGHDIDPVLYAAEPEVQPKYDSERDALEIAVIDDALTRHLPLLGICRGAQLLNARRGGNLFQELKSHRKMTSNRWTVLPLKTSVTATPMTAAQTPAAAQLPYPAIEVVTSEGTFIVELDRPRAPHTVANFVRYALDGHYDRTIVHRVIDGFVVQGGGYDAKFAERPTRGEIVNESGNGLSNERGTIAMARQNEPHSAKAQWYINLADNKMLDPSARRWGYAVFGRVVEGMEVVDKIAKIETGAGGPFPAEVPQKPVIVHSMRVIDNEAK